MATQPIDLHESVAGEEDPGASIDLANLPAASSGPAATRRPGEQAPAGGMKAGDQAPAGAPATGENVCPRCGGSGRLGASACPDCAGSGKVTTGIGGG